MDIEGRMLRRVCARFSTGVTLLTTTWEGEAWAMTANAFAFISEAPPIVMVSVNLENVTNDAIQESGSFAVNILRADQLHLARRFSTRDRVPMPFKDVTVRTAETDSPIIDGGLGWLNCSVVRSEDIGDHTVFFGEVKALWMSDDPSHPLLYYDRTYSEIGPPLEQHTQIRSRIRIS